MALEVSPQEYFHLHVLETTPDMYVEIEVEPDGAAEWAIYNDPSLIFHMPGGAVPRFDSWGAGDVGVSLVNRINSFQPGMHIFKMKVWVPSTQEEEFITFYILVTEHESDHVSPDSLQFSAIRNVQEADSQKIYVGANSGGMIITPPTWMVVTATEAVGTGTVISLQPMSFNQTPLDDYNDVLTIDDGAHTHTVQISYKILGGYDEAYSKSVHFTGDNDLLVFYKTTPDRSFLRISADVSVSGFDGSQKELELYFDVPFLEHKATLNLGKELEPYFIRADRMLGQGNKLTGLFAPMTADLNMSEIKYDDFSVVNQNIAPRQSFLPGKKSGPGPVSAPFWLDHRPEETKFETAYSVISAHLFKPADKAPGTVEVKKNGNVVKLIAPGPTPFNFSIPAFYSARLDLTDIPNLKPGDTIELTYPGIPVPQTYVIIPARNYYFSVGFETEWGTMRVLPFYGPNLFSVDYTHETAENIKEFVNHLRKVLTLRNQKVVMNTGWIHPSKSWQVDELINSRLALLLPAAPTGLMENLKYDFEIETAIELIPLSAEMTQHDSDSSMISFEVEFHINPKYANQIYLR